VKAVPRHTLTREAGIHVMGLGKTAPTEPADTHAALAEGLQNDTLRTVITCQFKHAEDSLSPSP